MRTRVLDRTRFVNYRGRADEFFKGMKTEETEKRYSASALLGIHAAIALADTVSLAETGLRAADDQHTEAAKLIEGISKKNRLDGDGHNRLRRILSRKNAVAYGEGFAVGDSDELKAVRLNVERFFLWAKRHFAYIGASRDEGG
jgi:hypothetical protein